MKLPSWILARTLFVISLLSLQVDMRGQDDDGDIWQIYFEMLRQQYNEQTGDSLLGPIESSAPETKANVHFSANQYAEAIRYFDLLIEKWPTGWNYFRRGYCHYMVKNYQLAVGDLTKSIARFPEPMLSPWWMGTTVSQSSKGVGFSKTSSISLVYQYVDAYFYRAESKLLLEDYYGCIADIGNYFMHMDTTAKRFPEQENSAWRMCGYSKLMLEDDKGAVLDFQAALKVEPTDSQSHYYLGVAYIRNGQVPAGCRALSRAGELGFADAYSLIRERCAGK